MTAGTTAAYENLRVETPAPGLARVTVNRPAKLNALNLATLKELAACFDALAPDVRVLVLTGAGEKAFVAGADIEEMSRLSPREAEAFSRLGHEAFARLEAMDRVVIAEVNGFALGGGCELVLACDLAFAAENAKLGQPEVKLGVTPGFGGTTRLIRRIGAAHARYLLYTGDQVGAAEAKAIGLVNEVLPAGELRARVDAVAHKILKNGPLAVSATKRALRVAAESDLDVANRFEQQTFALAFATEDQREGMTAFLERRDAAWKAR